MLHMLTSDNNNNQHFLYFQFPFFQVDYRLRLQQTFILAYVSDTSWSCASVGPEGVAIGAEHFTVKTL